MTRRLTTSTVREAHPYTRSKSPWILGEHSSMYGKLIHYLSGGGMSTFGRTVKQEEVRLRRRRFFIAAGVIAAVWTLFLFI
ncbi:MAG: hypothetical protein IKC80_10250 [Kiritimatiellae bacterium]|nr:hypothetical protein [Kiritimatiellia bacterium]